MGAGRSHRSPSSSRIACGWGVGPPGILLPAPCARHLAEEPGPIVGSGEPLLAQLRSLGVEVVVHAGEGPAFPALQPVILRVVQEGAIAVEAREIAAVRRVDAVFEPERQYVLQQIRFPRGGQVAQALHQTGGFIELTLLTGREWRRVSLWAVWGACWRQAQPTARCSSCFCRKSGRPTALPLRCPLDRCRCAMNTPHNIPAHRSSPSHPLLGWRASPPASSALPLGRHVPRVLDCCVPWQRLTSSPGRWSCGASSCFGAIARPGTRTG